MTDFNARYKYYSDLTEKALDATFKNKITPDAGVAEAAVYSLSAGGKRIRPVLCLAFSDMFGVSIDDAMPYACAIEIIHTFSLIHDDLPGMDNDDLRRGKPTCHKVYGEGMAILAGDALLNEAYSLILDSPAAIREPDKCLSLLRIISNATGIEGMIGGQAIDIGPSENTGDILKLKLMYSMKTGALIKAPVMIAAVLAGVPEATLHKAVRYAEATGLAFQIKDDILDVESTKEILGKSTGKDAAAGKNTFVTLLGVMKAKEYLKENTKTAFKTLDEMSCSGYDTDFLRELTNYLLVREN